MYVRSCCREYNTDVKKKKNLIKFRSTSPLGMSGNFRLRNFGHVLNAEPRPFGVADNVRCAQNFGIRSVVVKNPPRPRKTK